MTKHPKIEQNKNGSNGSKGIGLVTAREDAKTGRTGGNATTEQKRKELTLKTFNSVYESHKHSR